jgi:hypothetical protein
MRLSLGRFVFLWSSRYALEFLEVAKSHHVFHMSESIVSLENLTRLIR